MDTQDKVLSKREMAIEFVARFCDGNTIGLEPLLSENLNFSGPFHRFGSREEYLDVLRKDPPQRCGHRILSVTESEDAVSVFYEYEKPRGPLTVAQLFRFKEDVISTILLVFDGRGFA